MLVNDIAGIVAAVGPGTSNFTIGDYVLGQSRFSLDAGGLQQFAILDADYVAQVPSGISDDQAATFPINLVASYVALCNSHY